MNNLHQWVESCVAHSHSCSRKQIALIAINKAISLSPNDLTKLGWWLAEESVHDNDCWMHADIAIDMADRFSDPIAVNKNKLVAEFMMLPHFLMLSEYAIAPLAAYFVSALKNESDKILFRDLVESFNANKTLH